MNASYKRLAEIDDSSNKRRAFSAPTSPRLVGRRAVNGNQGAKSVPRRDNGEPVASVDVQNGNKYRLFDPEASLVLIGIRGSGKRSLGFVAATALGRRFVTEDHYFQTVTGISRQEFFKVHGSEEFYKQDVEVSRRMLDENKKGCVIDCGLGSMTSGLQDYLKSYSLTNPVVYIMRDMKKIKQLLNLGEKSMTRLIESGDPMHRRCSNYEFFNLEDRSQKDIDTDDVDRASPAYSFKLREAQSDFSHFVKLITGRAPASGQISSAFSLDVPVEHRRLTYALRLPVSIYEDHPINLYELEAGGDVVEIFVDRWKPATMRLLSSMVADVRRCLRVHIMLTASRKTAGMSASTYLQVLKHALRLGVELLSVDLEIDKLQIAELLAIRGSTRFVGTYINDPPSEPAWQDEPFFEMAERAVSLGIEILVFSRLASSRLDNEAMRRFRYKFQDRFGENPKLMLYNVGPLGRTTQVFNVLLNSVTHHRLTELGKLSITDQPSVSTCEAIRALFATFVLDPLHYYVLGANVTQSLSPAMHNAAYRALGFPHDYKPVNVKSWSDIEAIVRNPEFGGASIAQPWKVKIVSEVAHLSDHAKAIGAINTLIPLRGNGDVFTTSLREQASQRNRAGRVAAWYGENSDWVSIHVCLSKSLSPRNVIQPKTTALVVGAGGMARAASYALLQLGCRNIFIHNRTLANAQALAEYFNEWLDSQSTISGARMRVLESTNAPWPENYAHPTIIISCVTHEVLNMDETESNYTGSNFTVPEQWLGSETGGAAVEQAYYLDTPFVKQIKHYRALTGRPWVVVDGLEVLHEQAVAQFEIMIGKKAPRRLMWDTLMEAMEKHPGAPAAIN